MLHTNNPIIKHKAGLPNLAEELGNVSKARKVMGVSTDTFYQYQELFEERGIHSLIDKSRWVFTTNYNNDRAHQGKMAKGRTPINTLRDRKSIWVGKSLVQI